MEENIYTHNNKLFAAGVKGENLFEKVILESPTLIEWFGEIKEYEFHTDLKIQKKGIDYTLTTTSGIITVDVKNDSYLGKSGNILAELWQYRYGKEFYGWFSTAQCDFLVYLNTNNNLIYVLDFKEFHHQVIDYMLRNNFRIRTCLIEKIKGVKVVNALIPEDEIRTCFKKYTLDS